MGERKVLNKYYPPDFDASLLPRNRRPKDQQIKVRAMLPFTIQCATCSEYIYRGRKFNSRKELVQGEDYLGIKIWRFYLRCTRCNSEITFKTDPKNGSYVCEHGAKQYFEKFHEVFDDVLEEDQIQQIEDEQQDDPLALLESRQEESKREMEQLEALEELRQLTKDSGQMTYDELIEKREEALREKRKVQEIEDDLAASAAFFEAKKRKLEEQEKASSSSKSSSSSTSGLLSAVSSSSSSTSTLLSRKPATSNSSVAKKPKFVIKKKTQP